ncbi:MAG: AroM family protein [Chloroflexi bacterium]|nr:AroM family protein [Chloroflexota bacterium]
MDYPILLGHPIYIGFRKQRSPNLRFTAWYTVQMKRLVAEVTGKPVLLPRTLIARVAEELWGKE